MQPNAAQCSPMQHNAAQCSPSSTTHHRHSGWTHAKSVVGNYVRCVEKLCDKQRCAFKKQEYIVCETWRCLQISGAG
jgi:hypothetical protein